MIIRRELGKEMARWIWKKLNPENQYGWEEGSIAELREALDTLEDEEWCHPCAKALGGRTNADYWNAYVEEVNRLINQFCSNHPMYDDRSKKQSR